eukprot:TRINITY_DN4514_c0_g2_i2.p4 TRINITY_DN4514_c0_g2~~TRINITY_DN4514_c0_g2_i2.p4  ORF type:complete len:130 (+),score=11.86 TRINITY_DN4514_c0_g2_i2:686-1075(+)
MSSSVELTTVPTATLPGQIEIETSIETEPHVISPISTQSSPAGQPASALRAALKLFKNSQDFAVSQSRSGKVTLTVAFTTMSLDTSYRSDIKGASGGSGELDPNCPNIEPDPNMFEKELGKLGRKPQGV